jgi:hypothetical protein
MLRDLLQVSVLRSDLVKAGLHAVLQVAGSIVTANPVGLVQVRGVRQQGVRRGGARGAV